MAITSKNKIPQATPGDLLVIGSMNMDLSIKTRRMPRLGETLLGGTFNQNAGGKGANQAIAAHILFPKVSLCAGIGKDSMGDEYMKYLKELGIDTSLIKVFDNAHTGVAIITVVKEGENIITVAPGANLMLSPDDLKNVDFKKYTHVAFQLENTLETVSAGLNMAKSCNCTTILKASPACLLPDEILNNIDIIVANEIEIMQIMRGFTDMKKATAALLDKGIKNVIITLGARGCLLKSEKIEKRYPAHSVRPIDTVGAGDCFTGSFMAGLKIYGDIDMAIKMANAAAALSVTKNGAQSFASLDNVLKKMKG